MQKLTKYKPQIKDQKWYLLDAKGVRLGRLASEAVKLFLYKDISGSVDYMNTNVRVVVINSDFVDYHPRKNKRKKYYRHSGYPGNLKTITLEDQMKKDSRVVIRKAISGMLPKNKLRKRYLAQLYIEKNNEHDKVAQKPKLVKI